VLVAAEPVSAGKDRLVSFPAGPIWVSVAHSHLPAILLGNVSSGSLAAIPEDPNPTWLDGPPPSHRPARSTPHNRHSASTVPSTVPSSAQVRYRPSSTPRPGSTFSCAFGNTDHSGFGIASVGDHVRSGHQKTRYPSSASTSISKGARGLIIPWSLVRVQVGPPIP